MNMPALKYSQIHQGFYTFINEDVLPTCGIEVNVFWQALENLITDYVQQPSHFIDTSQGNMDAANTMSASITDRQQLIQAANSRWTSLHTTASQEETKAYLDQHFALETGSHADVKNYVVYYHHLLAFFEDGSQSGLVNPVQFVALCGHKCAPDSIVLKRGDMSSHVEIAINRKGNRGAKDCAGIQDILVETNETIIIDFDAVHIDGDSKIQAFRNLQEFLEGSLTTYTAKEGSQAILRMNTEVTFTDLDGEDYVIANRSPIQIRCTKPSLQTELMREANGNLAPQVIIDAIVCGIILRLKQNKAQTQMQQSLVLQDGRFTTNMQKRIDEIFSL